MSLLKEIERWLSIRTKTALKDWLPPKVFRLLKPSSAMPPLAPVVEPQRAPESNTARENESAEPIAIDDAFLIVEVDEAEAIVGDLFRRRFATDNFPAEPLHYIAFARLPNKQLLSLGYVHYILWEGSALCGGLVIDDLHYLNLPANYRKSIHKAGGVAELLLRQTFARLPANTTPIWGHVGNKQSEKVCLRVGFEHTDSKFVMAVWKDQSLTAAQKQDWVTKVEALGSF